MSRFYDIWSQPDPIRFTTGTEPRSRRSPQEKVIDVEEIPPDRKEAPPESQRYQDLQARYEELSLVFQDLQRQLLLQEQEIEALKHPKRALYVGDEEEAEPQGKAQEEEPDGR